MNSEPASEPNTPTAGQAQNEPEGQDQTESYKPSSRRPIAEIFRTTAKSATALCVRLNIHPDTISYASIVAAVIAGGAFWQTSVQDSGYRPLLLTLAAFAIVARLWFNMLDGMVALASGKASRRGELLNELPDRVSDMLTFGGLAYSAVAPAALSFWAMGCALLIAYVGTLGQALGVGRQYAGLANKQLRMALLITASLAAAWAPDTWAPASWEPTSWAPTSWTSAWTSASGEATLWFGVALSLILVFTVQTVWTRVRSILRGLT